MKCHARKERVARLPGSTCTLAAPPSRAADMTSGCWTAASNTRHQISSAPFGCVCCIPECRPMKCQGAQDSFAEEE
eukprot:1870760-Rhodomonas_salina.2